MTADRDLLALSAREFVDQTAAKTPTPGGGSVAGLVGALAAALGEMALNFTRGKKKFAEHEGYYAELAPRLEAARRTLLDLVAADVRAYELYQAATRLGDDDPTKPQAQALALAAATDVPRRAAATVLALLADLRGFADKCSTWLVSDLVASAALAAAALRLSDYNVRINALSVPDRARADELRRLSRDDRRQGEAMLAEIEAAVRDALP